MLDHILNEYRDFNPSFYRDNEDYSPISEPVSPEPIQQFSKKSTVKEMLKLRRQQMNSDPNFTSGKCDVFPNISSPQMACLTPPMTPNPAEQYPVSPPETVYSPPTPEKAPMTLFHWQIQQEAKRLEMMPPELVNRQDPDGDTYLHLAVAQGRRALSYVLAAKMAELGTLEIKEHNGQTALQVAAVSNQHLILQDLLTHGAQINTMDMWWRSPLHVCAERGYYQCLQGIHKVLKESGQTFDIEKINYDGLTPLHLAVLSHNAAVKQMRQLENPCEFRIRELERKKNSCMESIRTLMLMGASILTKEMKSGRNCLHMACEEANMDLLYLFLCQRSYRSFINIRTYSGNTALHIACSLPNTKHQVEAVKLLMRKGADPRARNFENDFPSQLMQDGTVSEKARNLFFFINCATAEILT
ncbi:NF-kappa-B inhibitor zeta [Oryzias melastigma]|uniref:NF-kappa-B inhibitor zeta n=1 Tax=Oryzias melastigma TaxID=30732 RepID=A0A834F247_ORYME|nr:NF-kappa-B inhibitor zeta [Oryzias melastigma]